MIAKHGGRYLTKGSSRSQKVVIGFRARRHYRVSQHGCAQRLGASPEYQPLIALRRSCTKD
jgi:uncharacterized protein (DUF1330 family)